MARRKKTRPRAQSGPSLKRVQELQAKMLETQEALGERTVTVSVGGGTVTVVMTGHQKVQSVKIAPEVVDPEDVEMLEDLIMAAVNEASEKAAELATQRLADLTGGLGIPGLM